MSSSGSQPSIDKGRVEDVARQAAAAIRRMLGNGVRVVWFGSWPQGRGVRGSDVDLAVDAGSPIPPADLARARAAVEEIRTLLSFDLVDMALAGDRLRSEVGDRGVSL